MEYWDRVSGIVHHGEHAEAQSVKEYTAIFEDVAYKAGFSAARMALEAELYASEVARHYEITPAFAERFSAGDVAIAIEHAAINMRLREREGEIETELDRINGRFDEAMDDPMTQHYGAGGDVSQMFGEQTRPLENELERIWLELRWRGAEPWPQGW